MSYTNLKKEGPIFSKLTITDDEIKRIKYKTEKQGHENISKSLKIDYDDFKKKYKN